MSNKNGEFYRGVLAIKDDGTLKFFVPKEDITDADALQQYLHTHLSRIFTDVKKDDEISNLASNLAFVLRVKDGRHVDGSAISILRTNQHSKERAWVTGHRVAVVDMRATDRPVVVVKTESKDPAALWTSLKTAVDNMVNGMLYENEEKVASEKVEW